MGNELIKDEIKNELNSILSYWKHYAVDNSNGGFYGLVNADNSPDTYAEKGIILNTRILWTFSAAYRFSGLSEYKALAERAYHYIKTYFFDHSHGGVYWIVDFKGNPVNRRKQIYAQAFTIYALSEYYKITKDSGILNEAIEIFHLIEKHSYDRERGGYIEAFDEQWVIMEDVRLGENDQNEKKIMNTHLHILEAYANLYMVWKNELLYKKLTGVIRIFTQYIINNESHHLNLFFDEHWMLRSSKTSFGHDIEASWLLYEAAEVLEDETLKRKISGLSLKIASAASKGLDKDGGLMNEFDKSNNDLDSDKHWWPQAEALVGFLNAYELSGDNYYFVLFLHSWAFIKKYIIDHENGEWFWRVDRNGNPYGEEKAGFWKCPYHNSRACIEVISRLERIENINFKPGEIQN